MTSRHAVRGTLTRGISAVATLALTVGTLTATAAAAPIATSGDTASAKAPRAMSETANPSRYVEVKFTAGTQRSESLSSSMMSDDAVASFEPLFTSDVSQLRAMSDAAGDDVNLAAWHRIKVKDGHSPAALVAHLRTLSNVEMAYVAPSKPPAPPASMTSSLVSSTIAARDLEPKQVYLNGANDSGVDAKWAWDTPGGSGKNVSVVDIEYGWYTNHEDLTALRNAVISRGNVTASWEDHGTAVAGELWADRDGKGVTGIVYDSDAKLSHASFDNDWQPARAVETAIRNTTAGDVILLEQQIEGCGGGFAPVEVVPSVYDVIKAATGRGIHVVEAAGNGSQNLDSSCYGGAEFPGGKGDSGAIIVGAGSSSTCSRTPRKPMHYSSYGTRVDLQGWGECVYSTGFGDAEGRSNNTNYTKVFSGTSSAAPIVTGVVASVSSIAEERGLTLTPAEMRTLLKETGLAQTGRKNIGPLPNIRRAVEQLGGSGPAPTSTPTSTPTSSPTTFPTSTPTFPTSTPTFPTTSPTTSTPTATPTSGEGYYENATSQDIRDYRSASTSINSQTANADKVNLAITIAHSCSEQLQIAVTTPDGRRNVIKRSGYAWRCTPWSGTKDDTFTMRSKSDGQWTLEVSDRQRGHEGTLNSWAITLT